MEFFDEGKITDGELFVRDDYWEKFLSETGSSPEAICAGEISFESEGFSNDAKIALVLSGKKTAIFSSYDSFFIDNEPLPVPGELYVVLNRASVPVCVIELESVNVIPFRDVNYDMAKREGEDESIESWRLRTQEILEDEGTVVGFDFSPDMKLVFQTFKVVYR